MQYIPLCFSSRLAIDSPVLGPMRSRLCTLVVVLCLAASSAWASKDALPKGALAGSGHTVGYGELRVRHASQLRCSGTSSCASLTLFTTNVQEEWRGEIIPLSWSPRAFLLRGFLSDEEADHLIKLVSARSPPSPTATQPARRMLMLLLTCHAK